MLYCNIISLATDHLLRSWNERPMAMMRKLCPSLLASAILATANVVSVLADPPDVVASIMPLHSWVSGVMDGVGQPTLLVKGGGSPHTYSLRPSEAKALQEADVVFWIGEELETFLRTPLEALPRNARVVALHEVEGVTLLKYRGGDGWEEHGHDSHHDELGEAHDEPEDHGHQGHGQGHAAEEHEEHPNTQEVGHAEHHDEEHDHGHAAGEVDMHIWLDPMNAHVLVNRIVAILSEVDPPNASRYQANGSAVQRRLADLHLALEGDLASVKDRPYVVFHDAYQYFETRYGLTPVGSITVSPDRKPGARTLAEIRERIAETDAACVFSEPQFEPAVVATVIEGTGARTAVLDPLGADLVPGNDAYFELMRNLAGSLTDCLREKN